MKSMLCMSAVLVIALGVHAGPLCEMALGGGTYNVVCDEVWVKYQEGATEAEIDTVEALIGGKELDHPFLQWRLYELTTGMSVQEAMAAAKAVGCVIAAQPEYVMRPCAPYEVTDPLWPDQRVHLGTDPEDDYPPTNSLGFNLDKMWAVEQGDPSIYLNVMDTGSPDHVDRCGPIEDHPDYFFDSFDPEMRRFVRFWYPDYMEGQSGCDFHGHGTMMFSIVGAIVNNVGMAGINHGSPILISKLYNSTWDIDHGQYRGLRRFIDAVSFLLYEDEHPERKMIALFAFEVDGQAGEAILDCDDIHFQSGYFPLVEDAIHEALHSREILFVFPSGRVDRYGINRGIGCPAWYSSCGSIEGHTDGYDNVVSVGAYGGLPNSFPQIPPSTNHSSLVNIYAPGGYTDPHDHNWDARDLVVGTQWHTLRDCMPWEMWYLPPDWGRFSGTSVAAANAAGAISLVWSTAASLTLAEVKNLVLTTAQNPSYVNTGCRGEGSDWGHGGVDGLSAMLEASVQSPLELSYDLVVDNTLDNCSMGQRPVRINRSIHAEPNTVLEFHAEVLPIEVQLAAGKEIRVHDAGTLRIICDDDEYADLTFVMEAGARIVVEEGGSIDIQGVPNNPVHFAAASPGQTWDGIKVNGGELHMEWAEIYDAPWSIEVDNPAGSPVPVDIRHTLIDASRAVPGQGGLRLWGSPSLTQKVENCVIENSNGCGMYLFNCRVDFDSVTVRNCSYVNSYLKSITGSFRYCTFEGRTSNYAVLHSGPTCTPNYQCCTFRNMAPPSGYNQATIACASRTSPSFGAENAIHGVSNVIDDDAAAYLLQMSGTTTPIIDNPSGIGYGGRNDWFQRTTGGKFIQWLNVYSPPPSPYKCEGQYWSPPPVISLFTPSGYEYFDFNPYQDSPWTLCGGGIVEPEEPELLVFGQAMELEDQGEYEEAQELYYTVASTTSDFTLRWQTAVRVVTTDVMIGSGSAWIPAFIDSLIASDGGYDAEVMGERLMACHQMNVEKYDEAIETCVELLGSNLTVADSLTVAIDLISVQMAAGLIPDGGGLDAERVPAGLRVTSIPQGIALEDRLLKLLGAAGEPNEPIEAVPTHYQLYQNYPNPFNPNTEIRFDLPEEVRVELKIYNSLGQLVAKLVDEVRPGGAYRVMWDSKSASGISVSSGVYVYQLKAGSFVDAKKMVLIK